MFKLYPAPDQELARNYLTERVVEYFGGLDRGPGMRVATAITEAGILSRPGYFYVTASFENPTANYSMMDPDFVWPPGKARTIPDAEPGLAKVIKLLAAESGDMMVLCDEAMMAASEIAANPIATESAKLNEVGHFICDDSIVYASVIDDVSHGGIENVIGSAWHGWLFGAVMKTDEKLLPVCGNTVQYSDLVSACRDVILLFTGAYDDEGVMIWIDDRMKLDPHSLPMPLD